MYYLCRYLLCVGEDEISPIWLSDGDNGTLRVYRLGQLSLTEEANARIPQRGPSPTSRATRNFLSPGGPITVPSLLVQIISDRVSNDDE